MPLVGFPKGETLWWVWAKPKHPCVTEETKASEQPRSGYDASGKSTLHDQSLIKLPEARLPQGVFSFALNDDQYA